MEKEILKYNIKQILAGRTEPQRLKLKKQILADTGINEGTFSRYINAHFDEDQDIPGIRLRLIANVLGTTPDDLYNEAGFYHYVATIRKQKIA